MELDEVLLKYYVLNVKINFKFIMLDLRFYVEILGYDSVLNYVWLNNKCFWGEILVVLFIFINIVVVM